MAARPGVIELGCGGKYDVGRVLKGGGDAVGGEGVTGEVVSRQASRVLDGEPRGRVADAA